MAAEREPLELRVYQHLLQKVSTRHWEPGVFLRPSSLATSLNVSRSTVRKALTRLVSDGWVQQTAEGYTYADAPPQNAPQDLESVLDHESQVEATYWLIFDWVLHAEFRGGDVVIPRTFADRFSVSMATVRHALDWLTRDGVLVRAPRRGWRFRSLTVTDIVDTIEIRTLFETEVLRRAGLRIPQETLRRLRAENEQVLEQIDTMSERDRRRADYVFHTTLIEQSTSSVLIDVVLPLIRRSMYVGLSCPPEKRHQAKSFREHLGILDALLAGQESTAIETLQAHLRRALMDAIPPLGSDLRQGLSPSPAPP